MGKGQKKKKYMNIVYFFKEET